jgi:hypothetical protein
MKCGAGNEVGGSGASYEAVHNRLSAMVQLNYWEISDGCKAF